MKRPLLWLTRAAILFPLVAVAGLALFPAAQPPPAWRTDLAAATREAKAAGKDVLVEFTVVGALGGPHDLDRKVYDRPEFLRGVAPQFVPVRLAVSIDADTPADVSAVALAERLAVAQVPSLVLMDKDGRPYAAVESVAKSVDVQLALVKQANENRARRDERFARADATSGTERAKHLHAALRHVGRFATSAYESVAREIVALDPDNASKLKQVYDAPLAEKRIDALVQSNVYPLIDRADFAGAVAAIDRIIADEMPPASHVQTLSAFKGQVLGSMGRTEESRRVLRDALAIAPNGAGAEKIRAAIEQLE